jgi:dTDP-4-amino-4,6-dideoxygalactose transaminase
MDNIYHIGTNRNSFENCEVSHYDWVDVGSKYQLNELNAAFLYDQLQQKETIFSQRKLLSQTYDELLRPLTFKNHFRLMPLEMIESNIHGYYIILKSKAQRNQIQNELKLQGIESFSHYRPLHLSPKGSSFANSNSCPNSSFISETLLRLPLHNELNVSDVENVCGIIHKFLD